MNQISVSQEKALVFLRFSLGFIFIWFGILKLFNVSPVLSIIQYAMPQFLAHSQIFFFLLSVLEILIGIGFFYKRLVKLAALVMIVHLLVASVCVLFTQGFAPRFPVLSLEGEFVVKNLVLIAGGVILLSHRKEDYDNKREEKFLPQKK